jgi:hypothetical protein
VGAILAAVLTLSGGFADMLYGSGLYDEAAVEYLREIHEAGDTLLAVPQALRLARCWQETGRDDLALGMYAFLSERLAGGDERAGALMGAATVYEEAGLPGAARDLYREAAGTFADAVMADRCEVLSAVALGRSGDWDGAVGELELLAEGGSDFAAEVLPRAVAARDHPYRSPAACAIASAVLPGSGQAICGHWTDGLTSLLMTAGTGALLAVSLEEEDTSGSVFFGVLALSFYTGGIMGAARGASRFNDRDLF